MPPSSSTAKGEAVALFHEPDNVLVYVVRTTGLVSITAAHVHIAPKGVAGGVIFPITASASSPGRYCGVSPRLTPAQVTALKAEGLYLNVHTSTYPGCFELQPDGRLSYLVTVAGLTPSAARSGPRGAASARS